jgi:cation diffusion facilitator CzcD-associated flavoprotein CzcO
MSVIDVAIIGAGISGINAAYRVQSTHPNASYTIFEGRDQIGGTWSLFKYPGLRSDSDLFSFGFEWNPWESDEVIAQADSILAYLKSSLASFGGDKHLKTNHKLVSLDWSTSDQLWTLEFEHTKVRAKWVVLGTGYYDYDEALKAEIPGLDKFKGKIVHPQFWPEDLDLNGKKVAIIGSGATAITILPSIIDQVEKVTLVQRSPSYIGTLPRKDSSAHFLKSVLPLRWATKLLRIKYLVLSFLFFEFCTRFPNAAKKAILKDTKKALPSSIPIDPHFQPSYNPWEQRFCLCPDGDFYAALNTGKGAVVTGHIGDMTENTIMIKDQPESTIEADIIVTATGLKVRMGGGARLYVDGTEIPVADKMVWRQCMLQDVPNLVMMVGYTNASWTLGTDTAAKTLTRMMSRLEENGQTSATAVAPAGLESSRFMKMTSTYLLKASGQMPNAGNAYPWLPRRNYFIDFWQASTGSLSKDMVS